MPKTRRRGSIKRRGNSFQVSLFLGLEAGKPRYFCKTTKGTRKDAERLLAEKIREFDQGVLPQKTGTLNDFVELWLESSCKVRTSARTAYGNESIYNRYFRNTIGSKKLDSLTPGDIQRVYAGLQARGLSGQTIKHAHSMLRAALNVAVKWRHLVYNPATLVETPRVNRVERRVLTAEEAKQFIDRCRSLKNGIIFEFALLTGTRPEEYLALQWKDIDWQRRTATIQRALIRHKGWHFSEPKTRGSRRSLELPDELVHKLVQHKQEQTFHRLRAQNLWHDHDLVFCSEFGTPHSLPNLTYRVFRPILKDAGLPHMRVYDLRHSHASLLLAADVNVKVVSERLGHSTVSLTLDRYSHVLPGMQRGVTEKLQEMIFASSN